MSGISLMPAELIVAYRATNFRVDTPDLTINLLIDEYNQELASLHIQHHVISSVV